MSLFPTNEDRARQDGEQQGFQRGYESARADARRNAQFNGLTPAEHERLTILFEEMAEATQVVGKILRHGYESYNPTVPNSPTNRTLLETELGHVAYAIHALAAAEDILADNVISSRDIKASNIRRYLHHQSPVEQTPWGLNFGNSKDDQPCKVKK